MVSDHIQNTTPKPTRPYITWAPISPASHSTSHSPPASRLFFPHMLSLTSVDCFEDWYWQSAIGVGVRLVAPPPAFRMVPVSRIQGSVQRLRPCPPAPLLHQPFLAPISPSSVLFSYPVLATAWPYRVTHLFAVAFISHLNISSAPWESLYSQGRPHSGYSNIWWMNGWCLPCTTVEENKIR